MLTEKDYKEFISLVKKMREAQKDEAAFESELNRKYRGNTWFMSTEEMMKRQELCNKVFDLTTEVDEYLKKMENESCRMVETERRKEETQAIPMGR